jgi:ferredoxin
MTMQEVFESFEKLHSYSFSTLDGDYPEIRIAHFLTYDDDGLYFQTMMCKPFYEQLMKSKKVAACALIADDGKVSKDNDGMSYFPPGYYIRVSGDVKAIDNEKLHKKALKDPKKFGPLEKDIARYPMMTTFVLNKFKGEVYDYDFEMINRDHKLERNRFSFNGATFIKPGFTIDKKACVGCGKCAKVCTFSAIIPGKKYSINSNRCDECGSCYSVCPENAIKAKTPVKEKERKRIGKLMKAYAKEQRKK